MGRLYPLHVDLFAAHAGDPAGLRMAESLASGMDEDEGATGRGRLYRGPAFDVLVSDDPVVSADWLGAGSGEGWGERYSGFVFLSRHAARSGVPALTCHSTGNFGPAALGGRDGQVAVPYPEMHGAYMRLLHEARAEFGGFEITIEATHHGPTDLERPSVFVEVGTTEAQWTDDALCASVAKIARRAAESVAGGAAGGPARPPRAVCLGGLGGTHYPKKFTDAVVQGRYDLGTVVPRHALEFLDEKMLAHVLERNAPVDAALVDAKGLGGHKARVLGMLESAGLEVVRA